MNRRALILAAASLSLLAACDRKPVAPAADTLTVAATAVPHAEILKVVEPILAEQGIKLQVKVFNDYVQPNIQVNEGRLDANYFQTGPYLDEFNAARGTKLVPIVGVHIEPILAEQGIKLQVKVFNDYVQPNIQVNEGRLDANYFQTGPYLDEFNAARGTKLVPIVGVHIEPLGAYSRKHKTLADLPAGATVAIPNEVSNAGRALLLLQKAGLITLKDPANPLSAVRDIATNPKGLKFKELESAALPRVLGEVDLAVINTNYALDAKLNPTRDALAIEDKNSPYMNFLVARADRKDDPKIKALAAALTSPPVKAFIGVTYDGAVVAAF